MAFHNINQGERFVYSRFMHALMSTCDPILFKNSSEQTSFLKFSSPKFPCVSLKS